MAKGIWVFAEQSEGTVRKVAFEILSQARKMADTLGEELCAVILGDGVESLADQFAPYGADKVYVVILQSYSVVLRLPVRTSFPG